MVRPEVNPNTNAGDLFSSIQLGPILEKEGRIEDYLKPGQMIMGQIVKEPISTKGSRLTAEISLAGRNIVLLPFADKVSISQKIASKEEKRTTRDPRQEHPPAELRSHHPHRRGRQERRGPGGRTPPAHREMGRILEEGGRIQGGETPLHRVLQDHHGPPRPAQRNVHQHPGQRPEGVRGDAQVHLPDLSRAGEDRQALRRAGADLRPFRSDPPDQELLRQGGTDEAGCVSRHRDHRGAQRDRRQQRHPGQDHRPGGEHLRGQQARRRGNRPPAASARYGRHRHRRFHRHGEARAPQRPLQVHAGPDGHRQGQAQRAAPDEVRPDAAHPPADPPRDGDQHHRKMPPVPRHRHITSTVVIDEEVERKIADQVEKGVKTMTVRVSPILGAYLTRGWNSFLRKWKRKYKCKLDLVEMTDHSILQYEIVDENGKSARLGLPSSFVFRHIGSVAAPLVDEGGHVGGQR